MQGYSKRSTANWQPHTIHAHAYEMSVFGNKIPSLHLQLSQGGRERVREKEEKML